MPSGDFENALAQMAAELADLRARTVSLEQALEEHGVLLPQRLRVELSGPMPSASQQTFQLSPESIERSQTPPPPPLSGHRSPANAEPSKVPFSAVTPLPAKDREFNDHSLESRIGSQWFNRIGILAVLIGMAWFLKYAIDNHWIGPAGRIVIGLLAGIGLISWSRRFQRQGFAAFAYSLKAVGSGILYLSLWAAFSVFHLIPAAAAFAAMIAVTAFNAFMAWVQDAELLALYAIVGALSTPLLLSTGENHEVALFSYLALLDLAVLVLVIFRPWSRLLFLSFVGTVAFYLGWWSEYYDSSEKTITSIFTLCFFVAFAIAPRLILIRSANDSDLDAWDTLASYVLPILNACLGFLAIYDLLDPSNHSWSGAFLAVGFAAFYLLLLRLPATRLLHDGPKPLAALHLAAAIVFLTIAIPLKAQGRWLTVGWLAEGAALLWTTTRFHSVLLRVLSLLCLLLGLVSLLVVIAPASTMPILNQRFATYCFGIAAFAFAAWLASRQAFFEPNAHDAETVFEWSLLAAAAILIVNGLILVALGWEIHSYWWLLRWHGDWSHFSSYSIDAQFSYSALFMIFGGILLAVGFVRRSSFLRWQALILLAATIGKVFLFDMSQLSQGYRIVSFLGLGALLLAVSFVYQRDWLKLRPRHSQSAQQGHGPA